MRRFLRAHDIPLEKLTPEHIERYLYARPISPRSQCVELEILRSFFRWCVQHERLMKRNPCEGVEKPKWQPALRPAPTWPDVAAVLRECRTLEERAIVELLYFSGLRISELRSLRVGNIDLARRQVAVTGKGGVPRVTVFPARVADVLRAFLSGDLAAWAFPAPKPRGRARGAKWIEATLRCLGRQAGLPYPLTAHILRHGWVRLCKTRGVPIEVTARLAGHRSIQTTAKWYGRMDIEDLQAAYDRHITT